MKIALPTDNDILCAHFGHCREFTIVEVDPAKKEILRIEKITPPPHEPGVLPGWLNQLECDTVIAGGMGHRAIGMFAQNGITVITGAPARRPDEIVLAYLKSELATGANLCDQSGTGHTHGGRCQSHGKSIENN